MVGYKYQSWVKRKQNALSHQFLSSASPVERRRPLVECLELLIRFRSVLGLNLDPATRHPDASDALFPQSVEMCYGAELKFVICNDLHIGMCMDW
jgi:hypothetical protein